MNYISDIPTEHWVTALTDSPNVHVSFVSEDEPIHEASADCACGPTASALSTGGTLYLHQTATPNPPPAPLPEGEDNPDVPHVWALVDPAQDPQVVLRIGHTATATAPDAPTGLVWVDVTDETPTPKIGWTYDGQSFAVGEHAQLLALAKAALNTNATFLALASPTNAQVLAQVRSLTRQINALIRLNGEILLTGGV